MPQTKRMPSVMRTGHTFSQVPSADIQRSVFDRSHGYKTTFDAGLLIPVYVDQVMPGDTFNLRMTAFARLTTPIKPLMDNMYLESFFFFVPYRLVWTNFVKFMGEQANPGDSIAYTVPQLPMPAAGYVVGSIGDYFGLPTVGVPAVTASMNVSALPGRAYFLIYNQWFRDENLVSSHVSAVMGDGPDSAVNGIHSSPLKRGKRHDYFTSCLPFLQKGTAVGITPSGSIPVVMAGVTGETASIQTAGGVARNLEVVGAAPSPVVMDSVGGGIPLTVSLAGLTVNDLRQSFQVQKFLERDARGGTRYPELVYSHFKVKSPDARLQRAEYLGGGSSPVNISAIAQQSQAAAPTFKDGLANLGGVGVALASGHGFSKSFTEHGVIIGLVNVRADLTYSQGIERFWSYSTRYDFPWPVLMGLGEQAVLNKEIYATGAAADSLVFGYIPRYDEARFKPSKVTGLFRPTVTGSLELWHLSEKFAALPTLGQTFIEDQTESILDTRVAVPTEPDFYFDAYFDLKCARPMPVFGVPGLIDHF